MFRVLFANPDPKLCDLYEKKLTQQKFLVDSAADGLTALRKFRANPSHVVISEYQLPVLSGLALLKSIRSHSKLYSTPFIFLSDHHDNSVALSLAANEWIEKQQALPEYLIERIYYHLKLNKAPIINYGI
jgi:two-component system chemotaxis response regulator CheY